MVALVPTIHTNANAYKFSLVQSRYGTLSLPATSSINAESTAAFQKNALEAMRQYCTAWYADLIYSLISKCENDPKSQSFVTVGIAG